jgi:CRISPR-associated endonuclease/helicase Cas3
LGKVVVFIPPKQPPPGILRKAAETSVRILSNGLPDPLSQSVFSPFFSELYWKANSLDAQDIIKKLTPDRSELSIHFRSAAEAFHLIDDSMQRNILIPYNDGQKWIQLIKLQGPQRWLLRRLQRYMVNVYTYEFDNLLMRGSIEEISPGIFSLICEVEYDEATGLKTDTELFDPAKYISC